MRDCKKWITLGLVLAILNGSSWARPDPDQQAAKVLQQVTKLFNEGSRIRVELQDGRKLQGSPSELGDKSFVLTDEGRSTTVAYAEVRKVKRQGPSKNKKVLVPLAVLGGLAGLVLYSATQMR